MDNIQTKIAAILACIGLSACHSIQKDRASLEMGDSFLSRKYELNGNRASLYYIQNNHTKIKREKTKSLNPSEVSAFWEQLEKAEVRGWLRKYQTTERDGRSAYGSYDLNLVQRGVLFESEGDAAYPSDASPKTVKAIESSKRFDVVADIFTSLFK